jgi:hypothetical protein
MLFLSPTMARVLEEIAVRLRRRRRRGLVPRLLSKRISRRVGTVVGACAVCGVRFAGPPRRHAELTAVLRAHEAICPGGRRSGLIVTPLR